MGQSLRIRTEVGVDKNISFQLDQDFEFLEILSLQILQNDVYPRDCADYGVVVGRVVANGGLGVPNAKVSIFVPINEVDSLNDRILQIYPYTQPNDKNVDGYRFNLLPYVRSYTQHAATGTFPSRLDVLDDPVVVDIYDTYYKFTVKTNESGDFMILGVPVGQQTIVMDLDLSDIGEFSLTPQDLIRMGLATEAQVAGDRFRSSTDLDSLPQIINITKTFEVSPFWGDPTTCQSSISRIDFDLRDEANVEIQPTAIFMGSLYSTGDNFKIAAPVGLGDNPPSLLTAGCKPKDNMGNLCQLEAGPGQIVAVRQTLVQDSQGRPILEEYRLENSGNVIDGNGTWLVEVPMNLDYVTTSEDGQRIFSRNPSVGIPTKSKYRFKVKWQQSPTDTEPVKRGYFLLPNVREWGWRSPALDPNYDSSLSTQRELASSYYFGIDWTGYTDAESATVSNQKLQAAINCEDTFYEFEYNKVYTPSGLIDRYKRGINRGRFLGIKEIGNNDCESTINKFPVNDGVKNFSASFFLFAILMQFIQVLFPPLLFAYHLIGWIANNILVPVLNFFIRFQNIMGYALIVIGSVLAIFGGAGIPLIITGAALLIGGTRLSLLLQRFVAFLKFKPLKLPMITYPECTNCDCNTSGLDVIGDATPTSLLSPLTTSGLYYEAFENYAGLPPERIGDDNTNPSDANVSVFSLIFSEAIGTRTAALDKFLQNRSTQSQTSRLPDTVNLLNIPKKVFSISEDIPMAQRINVFNGRKKYFDGVNKISVSFDYPSNTTKKHFDNTITLLSQSDLAAGTLLSFVGISNTSDPNFLFSGNSDFNGITGTTLQSGAGSITVNYATSQTSNSSETYFLNTGSTIDNYRFPADIEYYQVLTAITVADAFAIASGGGTPNCLVYELETDLGNPNVQQIITVTYVDCSGNNQQTTVTSVFNQTLGIYDQGFQQICASTVPQIIQGTGTVTPLGLCSPPNPFGGILEILNSSSQLKWSIKNLDFGGWEQKTPSLNVKTRNFFSGFDDQYILILQRGVDPYSPLYVNRYGIGSILGIGAEDSLTFTAQTRLNIPIQSLPANNISVQQHTSQNNIFYPSYFFEAGNTYTAFTTSNVGYYSAIDGNRNYSIYPNGGSNFGFVSGFLNTPINSSVEIVISNGVNKAFSATPSPAKYDSSEDLSGVDFYYIETADSPVNSESGYYCFSLLPTVTGTTTQMNLSNKARNVLRTDRLPSSDFLDGTAWNSIVPVLQMNRGFSIYVIDTGGENLVTTSYGAGATITGNDIEDLPDALNVLDTFSCPNMVALTCYSNSGNTVTVNANCNDTDWVDNGCYIFARRLISDLPKDLLAFNEWGLRYRFFYALCSGVLSQTFSNNWVNGSLYSFPFAVRTLYGGDNRISRRVFCKDLIYYNEESNNFYYRSSPYSPTTDSFIGKLNNPFTGALNDYSLQMPTTIMNLGPKTAIFKELTLNPSDDGFVMDALNPTSYGDTSDLLNLFVISRITNSYFLQILVNQFPGLVGTNLAINSLFSRPTLRLDGDITQLLSINSEFGVEKFSAQSYQEDPTSPTNPIFISRNPNGFTVLGIFFSSTTEDLQYKDYLSPGRINFRPTPNSNAYPYYYELKSQRVPFYRWKRDDVARWVENIGTFLNLGNEVGIFGTQSNDWATDNSEIFSKNYQSLDRTFPSQPSYFLGSNSQLNDIYARGYIFNVDSNGANSATAGNYPDVFAVGAPNHFYFGLIKGETALDRFKSKYLADE